MGTEDQGLRRLTGTRFRLNVRHLQDRAAIWRETIADGHRHVRYSAATDGRSALSAQARQIEAQITKDYHRIEKGLALRSPRANFSAAPAARLDRDLPRYQQLPDHDPAVVAHARSALDSPHHWHAHTQHTDGGPTKSPVAWAPLGNAEAEALFRSRGSVRDFAAEPLDVALVRRALSSPSVCNRQAWGLRVQPAGLGAVELLRPREHRPAGRAAERQRRLP